MSAENIRKKLRFSYLMLPLAESFDELEAVSVSSKFHAYPRLAAIYTKCCLQKWKLKKQKVKPFTLFYATQH